MLLPTIQEPSPMPVIVIFFGSDGTDVYPSASDTVSGVVVVGKINGQVCGFGPELRGLGACEQNDKRH